MNGSLGSVSVILSWRESLRDLYKEQKEFCSDQTDVFEFSGTQNELLPALQTISSISIQSAVPKLWRIGKPKWYIGSVTIRKHDGDETTTSMHPCMMPVTLLVILVIPLAHNACL